MIRSISIEPVLNGFILQVGCQKVVFGDTKTLANEIRKYYDDPEETEKLYLKNAINKMSDIQAPCTTTSGNILSWNVDPNPPRYAIAGTSQ